MTDPAKMPELPEPKRSMSHDWPYGGQVVSVDDAKAYARAYGRACLEERAATWQDYHGFDKYGVAAFIRYVIAGEREQEKRG